MSNYIIESILLGFAISAAPGAVFFETIRRALSKKDFVITFQLGNFSGMLIIATLALTGVSILFKSPALSALFYALSGVLLIYIGTASVLIKPRNDSEKTIHNQKSNYTSFISGLVLAIANPLSIIFWISVVGKYNQQYDDGLLVLLNTGSIVVGAFILFFVLITTVNLLRKKISERSIAVIARMSGIVIIVYGLVTLTYLL